MTFRVYRLPGSQRVWHVDTGVGTTVINVFAFMSDVPVRTVKGDGNPLIAWIEIEGNFFVDRNDVGKFMAESATLLPDALAVIIRDSKCTFEVMDAAEKLSQSGLTDEELERLTRPESKPEVH